MVRQPAASAIATTIAANGPASSTTRRHPSRTARGRPTARQPQRAHDHRQHERRHGRDREEREEGEAERQQRAASRLHAEGADAAVAVERAERPDRECDERHHDDRCAAQGTDPTATTVDRPVGDDGDHRGHHRDAGERCDHDRERSVPDGGRLEERGRAEPANGQVGDGAADDGADRQRNGDLCGESRGDAGGRQPAHREQPELAPAGASEQDRRGDEHDRHGDDGGEQDGGEGALHRRRDRLGPFDDAGELTPLWVAERCCTGRPTRRSPRRTPLRSPVPR